MAVLGFTWLFLAVLGFSHNQKRKNSLTMPRSRLPDNYQLNGYYYR